MSNFTVQKLVLGLITFGAFLAAPWLTSEFLGGNSTPLFFLGAAGTLFFFVYVLRDRCWMIIPFTLPIQGNLNFIPLNFSIQELSIMIVFSYLLFRMIFGLNVGWKLGPALLWLPLAGLFVIIMFHWVESRDIGIKLLGGSGWGGRKYFKVVVALFSIPLLASFPELRWADLQKVPMLYFLGSFVDIVPGSLSTLAPATAPYIWKVYSGVNLGEYQAFASGAIGREFGITRISQFDQVGSAVSLLLLSYFPANTWIKPERLWVFPTILLSGVLCAASGFRNSVVRYFLSLLAALYTTIGLRSLLIIPCAVAFTLVVAFSQGKFFNYPLALQRALSFLPGDWNPKAKGEANASSDWRGRMKELFYKEYFPKNPLLGSGYHYNPVFAKQDQDVYLASIERARSITDNYFDVRGFIERREPHEGLVHALLVSGLIGTSFFVAYCLALLLFCFRNLRRTPRKEIAPIQTWAISLLFTFILAFYLLGGDYSSFFLLVCPISALLFRVDQLLDAKEIA